MMKDNLYTDSILCRDRQDHYDSRLDLAGVHFVNREQPEWGFCSEVNINNVVSLV